MGHNVGKYTITIFGYVEQLKMTYTPSLVTFDPDISKDGGSMFYFVLVHVFGDIMVLASSPPPVDPDDVNILTQKIFNLSLSNFIYW